MLIYLGIFFLLALNVQGQICVNSAALALRLDTYLFEDSNYLVDTTMYNIREGPVSGEFYSIGKVEDVATNGALIRKTDESNTVTWAKVYNTVPSEQFFVVDSLETNLYFLDDTAVVMTVIDVDPSTGAVNTVKTSADLSILSNNLRVSPLPGSGGFAFTADSATELGHIGCRWTGGAATLDCYKYDQDVSEYSILTISSDKFYSTVQGTDNKVHYMMADFTNLAVFSWSKYSTCVLTCVTLSAGSTYASDVSEIYTVYNVNSILLFFGLQESDGALVDSQYSSSIGCTDFYDIVYNSQKVYFSASCGVMAMTVYDVSTRTLKYFDLATGAGVGVYLKGMEPKGLYLYLIGDNAVPLDNDGVKAKVLLSSIDSNSTTVGVGYMFTSFITGDYQVLPESINLTSFVTKSAFLDTATVSDSISANNEMPGLSSDLFVATDDVTITGLISEQAHTESINPTCTISGLTPLTYTLNSFNDTSVLTWVSLSGSDMIINPPVVSSVTTYGIIVETTSLLSVSNQTYFLEVNPKPVTTSNESSEISSTRNANRDFPNAAIVAACLIAALLAIVALLYTILAGGIMIGFWSIINQLQFLVLLPFVFGGLPGKITTFLAGLDFSVMNFHFIQIENLPLFSDIINIFDCGPKGEYFRRIGLERSCTFTNFTTVYVILGFIGFTHIVVLALYFYSKAQGGNLLFDRVMKVIFRAFTFSVYIRYLIEGCMILTLASMFEFGLFDFNSGWTGISFFVSTFIIFAYLATLLSSLWVGRLASRGKMIEDESKVSEFVRCTNTQLSARMTVFLHLSRVLLSVLWVVAAQDVATVPRACVFICIQVAFAILKSGIQPFNMFFLNFIEIFDDWFYIGLCFFLLIRDVSNDEDILKEEFFIILVLINMLIILVIYIVLFLQYLTKTGIKKKNMIGIVDPAPTKHQMKPQPSQHDTQDFQVYKMNKNNGTLHVDRTRECFKSMYCRDIDPTQKASEGSVSEPSVKE